MSASVYFALKFIIVHPEKDVGIRSGFVSDQCLDFSPESEPFFGEMLDFDRFHSGHLLPAVSSPSLHHHEQVELGACCPAVVGKILHGVLDISLHVGREQQVGEYVVLIGGPG